MIGDDERPEYPEEPEHRQPLRTLEAAARDALVDLAGWHRLAASYGWGRPEWQAETERVMAALRAALDSPESRLSDCGEIYRDGYPPCRLEHGHTGFHQSTLAVWPS